MADNRAKFQFYETFENIVSLLPTDEQLRFYKSIVRYGLFAEQPSFDGKDSAIFQPIKEAIDNQQTRKVKNAENGRLGGLAKSSNSKQTVAISSEIHEEKRNENEKNDEDEEENSSSSFSDSQKEYAKIIFELLKNEGLPCQNGDYFKFLSCDFKNALQYIKSIHSDDVIESVRNYITVLRNPDSYLKTKFNFCSFVQSKTFTNCLPANFRPENFKRFGRDSPKAKETEKINFWN